MSMRLYINAGIANACTGEKGLKHCSETAQTVSETMNIPENSVLVASTGVIGMEVPMDKICAGIGQMAPELSRLWRRGRRLRELL